MFLFLCFDDKEAGYENQGQIIVSLTKVIRGFMGMEGLMDRGVYSGIMLFSFFLAEENNQSQQNNQSVILIA